MSDTPRPAFDKPMIAGAIDGEVAITGPGHVHGSFTPDAARESAEQLKRVADAARDQAAGVADPGAAPEAPAEDPC